MNLVVNARDAMPEGGQITIDFDIEESPVDGRVLSGPCAKVSVSDNGTGMDEATQVQIFEPFFTTKEVGKGTGLGLATVYAIIDRHGGRLSVASEVGEGTCFSIFLPLAGSEMTKERPAIARSVSSPPDGTILVVEDEEAVRHMVVKSLAQAGYQVFEANDGGAAADFIATHAGTIHLLITDIVMPKASGWEVAEAFVEKYEDGAVLFMSGYADRKADGAELLARHQPLLAKPFSRIDLLGAVAKKLNRRSSEIKV